MISIFRIIFFFCFYFILLLRLLFNAQANVAGAPRPSRRDEVNIDRADATARDIREARYRFTLAVTTSPLHFSAFGQDDSGGFERCAKTFRLFTAPFVELPPLCFSYTTGCHHREISCAAASDIWRLYYYYLPHLPHFSPWPSYIPKPRAHSASIFGCQRLRRSIRHFDAARRYYNTRCYELPKPCRVET